MPMKTRSFPSAQNLNANMHTIANMTMRMSTEMMHQAIPFGNLGPIDAAWTAHSGMRPPMNLHSERAHFAPIIAACWSQAPDHRPTLTEVARRILQLESVALGLDMAAGAT